MPTVTIYLTYLLSLYLHTRCVTHSIKQQLTAYYTVPTLKFDSLMQVKYFIYINCYLYPSRHVLCIKLTYRYLDTSSLHQLIFIKVPTYFNNTGSPLGSYWPIRNHMKSCERCVLRCMVFEIFQRVDVKIARFRFLLKRQYCPKKYV